MQFKALSLLALATAASAQNLTTLLSSTPSLSNLTTFVSLFPSLLTTLSTATNITILAPSNDAFTKLLNSTSLNLNDTAAIQALLSYHVLTGVFPASDITASPAFIPTLLTNTNYTNVTGGQVVEAEAIGGKVYFFSGLLQNSSVTTADVKFNGGIVHIIDTVLTVPANVSTTATVAGLTGIVGALNATNLTAIADTIPEVTIFAPSNSAFAAIGSALQNLTAAQLTNILEYHVINGTVAYSSLLKNETVKALNGGNLTITIINGTVFVDSAKVIVPNVLIANGVVHVIDSVLNPGNATATPNPTASSPAGAFSGASSLPSSTSSAGSTVTSAAAAYAPMKTGAMGAAVLFAAGNAWLNV